MAKDAAVENQLDYVRRRVIATPVKEWQRVATDAGVPHRTLYNLKREDFDPRYSTVIRLYGVLKLAEMPKKTKVAK